MLTGKPPRGGSGVQNEQKPPVVHVVSHVNSQADIEQIIATVDARITKALKEYQEKELTRMSDAESADRDYVHSEDCPCRYQDGRVCTCAVYNPARSASPPADPEPPEAVNHPAHYNAGQYEVIEVIRDAGLNEGFCLGNALKYILRYKYKNGLEDLKKARWYLDYYIRELEAKTDAP